MKAETRAQIQEAQNKIDKAWRMLQSLCSGKVRWHMSIPARPDSDPDLVIADGLHAGKELLDALAAEPEEPTVSKSVEELAKKIEDKCYESYSDNNPDIYRSSMFYTRVAEKLIQQFLDAQLAEREKLHD
jgi:hypothetical protein